MGTQDAGFDFYRYRQLLAEAVDEKKRRALIDLLVEERAKARLEAQRVADLIAMTETSIAEMLRTRTPDLARPANPLREVDHPAPAIAMPDNSR